MTYKDEYVLDCNFNLKLCLMDQNAKTCLELRCKRHLPKIMFDFKMRRPELFVIRTRE